MTKANLFSFEISYLSERLMKCKTAHRKCRRLIQGIFLILGISLIFIITQQIQAQDGSEENKGVSLIMHLERSQVEVGENVMLLVQISNNSDETLEHLSLKIHNQEIEIEKLDIPNEIKPQKYIAIEGSIHFLTPGSITLLPTLSYTTTTIVDGTIVVPEDLPTLTIVSDTILPLWLSDFPRELISVLVGVVVTLVSLGLTQVTTKSIERKQREDDVLKMLTATLKALLFILANTDTSTQRPIPVNTLNSICASPNLEALLARLRRHIRRFRSRKADKMDNTMDESLQALVKLQAEAQYYDQVFKAREGDVSGVVRDALHKKAAHLQSLLREIGVYDD